MKIKGNSLLERNEVPSLFFESKPIWRKEATSDQYVLFEGEIRSDSLSPVTVYLSCDSNYEFFYEGKLISNSISPSYPEHSIVDSFAFVPLKGKKRFRIRAYHLGSGGFSSYCNQPAFLRFVLVQEGVVVARSDENTTCSLDPVYVSGKKKIVSPQLGYRPFVDLTKGEGELRFEPSSIVSKDEGSYEMRGNQKCLFDSDTVLTGKREVLSPTAVRTDLGREEVGYLSLDLLSPKEQTVTLCYGEHLTNGNLVYQIGNRCFAIEIKLKKGRNVFFEGFLRIGARYLELHSELPLLAPPSFGLVPVHYPFHPRSFVFKYQRTKELFEVAKRTLSLCYHEHYEDCPWREQCLYALDSLNQIDAGLLLFENQEQIRSSLSLISQDKRKDELLSICSPSRDGLTIPSFSLFYFLAVEHYLRASGDLSFGKQVYSKLERVLSAFLQREEGDLIPNFEGEDKWNFYEWEEGLDGELGEPGKKGFDLCLNALTIIALRSFERISELLEKPISFKGKIEKIQKACRNRFYDKRKGVYRNGLADCSASVLGNSLAILADIASKEEAMEIAKKLVEPLSFGLTETSLSMKRFLYDALLKTDEETHRPFVLADIYSILEETKKEGNGTFFETMEGWRAFEGAGSLCHGWGSTLVLYPMRFGELEGEHPSLDYCFLFKNPPSKESLSVCRLYLKRSSRSFMKDGRMERSLIFAPDA